MRVAGREGQRWLHTYPILYPILERDMLAATGIRPNLDFRRAAHEPVVQRRCAAVEIGDCDPVRRARKPHRPGRHLITQLGAVTAAVGVVSMVRFSFVASPDLRVCDRIATTGL
ncbi:hypothetical protein LAUMK4_01188 [Mycobacterium persicum]|uniref:Uncharacterized protein n=1 Tax=Mycobacterium persicum TaxID=1487726 RepID=A0AB38UPQ5_9MYCO|nr:hypothetical protein BST40_25810 [Mycobacterium persicum]ORB91329.1 hypothetical protein B1T49_21235 [Mycobacterium persicum]ORB96625.1 hypothetical protein B1T44_21400 [Mycobacterium persicum]ORC03336.1 hypothetical protein B1T48_20965 [Mycobacterium persicum]VAZ72929.1 hypothetical protein LAUMK15_01545 [Mycobacterium persicum]